MGVIQSFDVTSGWPSRSRQRRQSGLQEISQRFDFKGLSVSIELRRKGNLLVWRRRMSSD